METREFVLEIPGEWLGKPPKEVEEREKRGEGRRGKKS